MSGERWSNAPLSPAEIRQLRQNLQLDQSELATLVGCHPVTICRWEHGQGRPTAWQTALLTRFFEGVDMGEVPDDLSVSLRTRGPIWVLWKLLSLTEVE